MRRNLGRKRRRGLGRKIAPRLIKNTTGKHYVYCITIEGSYYYGYTGRSVSIRIKEHLTNCKNGIKNKLYNKLRKYDYKHTVNTIEEFDEEYHALVKEIELIAANASGLNISPGGEGTTMKLAAYTDSNGTVYYKTL